MHYTETERHARVPKALAGHGITSKFMQAARADAETSAGRVKGDKDFPEDFPRSRFAVIPSFRFCMWFAAASLLKFILSNGTDFPEQPAPGMLIEFCRNSAQFLPIMPLRIASLTSPRLVTNVFVGIRCHFPERIAVPLFSNEKDAGSFGLGQASCVAPPPGAKPERLPTSTIFSRK